MSVPAKVHEERVKLRATYLNGLAIALFALGVLAPTIGAILTGVGTNWPVQLVATLLSLGGSLLFHYLAWRTLGGLS